MEEGHVDVRYDTIPKDQMVTDASITQESMQLPDSANTNPVLSRPPAKALGLNNSDLRRLEGQNFSLG